MEKTLHSQGGFCFCPILLKPRFWTKADEIALKLCTGTAFHRSPTPTTYRIATSQKWYYIQVINSIAERAAVILATTGKVTVIVQDNGSLHTSQISRQQSQLNTVHI